MLTPILIFLIIITLILSLQTLILIVIMNEAEKIVIGISDIEIIKK